MAAIMPKNPLDKVSFCESHESAFSTNAVAIGTTVAKVTTMTTLTTAARAAYRAQQEAQNAARAATNTFNNAVDQMADACTIILKDIKAMAATVADPDAIYDLAQVPPPATPSPVGPPGMPESFRISLLPSGALQLKWQCGNPRGGGVQYQVSRRTGTAGDFQIIGGSGKKLFIDDEVPAGVPSVTYRVQATRSTARGVANDVLVNFGVGGSGETTALLGPESGGRLAA